MNSMKKDLGRNKPVKSCSHEDARKNNFSRRMRKICGEI
jgi:hypothetical protein